MVSSSAAYLKGSKALAQAKKNISLPVVCAVEGDSRCQYGTWGQCASWRGFQAWLQTLSNQRLKFPSTLNTAVAGNTSDVILARLPGSISAAVAAGASAMFVIVGINDRIANYSYATTMANVQSIVSLIQASGLTCFLFTDTSQGSGAVATTLTTAQQQIQRLTRQGYLALHNPQANLFVVDMGPTFDDPLATTAFNLTSMVADGTHDTPLGSLTRANAALPYINQLWKPTPFAWFTSNGDLYNATNNPNGCLTANPMVDGTTGTINAAATNASGNVATGWSFSGTTTGLPLTAVLSKVTDANGLVWQQATISGQVTASSLTNYPTGVAQLWFYQTISLASAPIGSKVQVSAQVQYDSGMTNVSSILVGSEAAITGGSQRNYTGYRGTSVANAMVMPQGPQSLYVTNEPMIIPATTSVHIMRIGIEVETNNLATAITFRFRGAGARIVS